MWLWWGEGRHQPALQWLLFLGTATSFCALASRYSVEKQVLFFFNFILKLAYFLFLAVPGLHCCMQTFFSCGKQGPLSSCGTDASCCVGFCYCGARALGHLGFSSTGPWAQSLQGIWNLPGLGIKPVLPALAGEFLTTGPPGKPRYFLITGSSTPSLLSPSSFLSYISKQLGS